MIHRDNMRKPKLIVVFLIVSIGIIGCGFSGNSDSVVIGGSDGPTSIYLAPKRKEKVTEFPEGLNSEYEWNQFVTEESCVSEKPEEEFAQEKHIGLSMYAKDVTSTSCTLVFVQSGGNVKGELQTGQEFELQVKNGNGDWVDDSAKDMEIGWEDIAYLIKSGGITELQTNWEHIYGKRGAGHYRIVKEVKDFRGVGDFDTYELYAEFDIG